MYKQLQWQLYNGAQDKCTVLQRSFIYSLRESAPQLNIHIIYVAWFMF